mmetsp:Transcript_25990/g.103986  ORF Transcript_25990/g.103986 Transcript_25990/m.103986 type:complete len:449 (-) Transcript_25990:695-2041(-)
MSETARRATCTPSAVRRSVAVPVMPLGRFTPPTVVGSSVVPGRTSMMVSSSIGSSLWWKLTPNLALGWIHSSWSPVSVNSSVRGRILPSLLCLCTATPSALSVAMALAIASSETGACVLGGVFVCLVAAGTTSLVGGVVVAAADDVAGVVVVVVNAVATARATREGAEPGSGCFDEPSSSPQNERSVSTVRSTHHAVSVSRAARREMRATQYGSVRLASSQPETRARSWYVLWASCARPGRPPNGEAPPRRFGTATRTTNVAGTSLGSKPDEMSGHSSSSSSSARGEDFFFGIVVRISIAGAGPSGVVAGDDDDDSWGGWSTSSIVAFFESSRIHCRCRAGSPLYLSLGSRQSLASSASSSSLTPKSRPYFRATELAASSQRKSRVRSRSSASASIVALTTQSHVVHGCPRASSSRRSGPIDTGTCRPSTSAPDASSCFRSRGSAIAA